jgi:3-methylfumaryl-CoA hydratase
VDRNECTICDRSPESADVPPDRPITEDELAIYRTHMGRRIEEKELISAEIASRFAVAVDHACLKADAALPPMWHYGFFLTETATALLGEDGHPPRGDFMPAIRLPRRMFAGADIQFHAPLLAGREATKISEIVSIEHRHGKSGDLVFVRVKIAIRQDDMLCIEEEQTIVYRGVGAHIAPITPLPPPSLPAGHVVEEWTPRRVELFRFSAVTFNAHRIHYDFPYATEIEAYPDLVVHGPLTAFRLCALARRAAAGALKRFSFRGEAPLFVDQPVRLIATASAAECRLFAERCDGARAMTATAAC